MSRTVMSVVKLAGGNQEAQSCNDCGNSAVSIRNFFYMSSYLFSRVGMCQRIHVNYNRN